MSFSLNDLTHLIEKHHFCTLATEGVRGPHVAGVSYFARGLEIYIASSDKTTKVRNLRRNPNVALHISVPWSILFANQPPPKSIQFKGIGEILPFEDRDARAALDKAPFVLRRVIHRLARNTDTSRFGENVWIRIRPQGMIETFMVGVPLTTIFRDETKAIQHFKVP